MYVGVRDAEVVGPTASFGEIPVRRRRLQVVTDKQGNVSLSVSPGRIDPTNPAFEDSRKPVVGQFKFRGQTLFVAAVHFSSKGGDDPLFGRGRQPVRFREEARHARARVVRTFVDEIMAKDPAANRWTYVCEGNSQVLDHILISTSLASLAKFSGPYRPGSGVKPAFVYDIVHTNAAFLDQDSDHDPQVVHLDLKR